VGERAVLEAFALRLDRELVDTWVGDRGVKAIVVPNTFYRFVFNLWTKDADRCWGQGYISEGYVFFFLCGNECLCELAHGDVDVFMSECTSLICGKLKKTSLYFWG